MPPPKKKIHENFVKYWQYNRTWIPTEQTEKRHHFRDEKFKGRCCSRYVSLVSLFMMIQGLWWSDAVSLGRSASFQSPLPHLSLGLRGASEVTTCCAVSNDTPAIQTVILNKVLVVTYMSKQREVNHWKQQLSSLPEAKWVTQSCNYS